MVPLKGRFVDLGMLGNVIGDDIKFLSLRMVNAWAWTSWKGTYAAISAAVNSLRTCPAFCRFSLLLVAVFIHLVFRDLFTLSICCRCEQSSC